MKTAKITKEQIIEGATFDCVMGKVTIVSVEKDGYRKGLDRVYTNIGGTGGKDFADSVCEIRNFINSNRK